MITTSDNIIVTEGEKPPPSIRALPVWPKDNVEELEKFYGKHEIGENGIPTNRWESSFLTDVSLAYPMWYVGGSEPKRITRLRCHRSVVTSLNRIFGEILRHYGSVEAIHEARMDLTGGCFCYRMRRGGSSLSTHAWGVAIDLDPEKNPLGRTYDSTKGMMPKAIVEIFQDEGWIWGGKWRLPDAMHFQAATT